MTETRQLAHELIDQLPESQLSGLVEFLRTIVDPAARALAGAPLEDEEVSDAEERAAEEARESLKRNGGKGIPHKEAMRQLGLD